MAAGAVSALTARAFKAASEFAAEGAKDLGRVAGTRLVRPVLEGVDAVGHVVATLMLGAAVVGSGGVEWAVLTTALALLVLAR
jgi:hypothetical protein